jgi:hypothetical protein
VSAERTLRCFSVYVDPSETPKDLIRELDSADRLIADLIEQKARHSEQIEWRLAEARDRRSAIVRKIEVRLADADAPDTTEGG